MVVLDYNQYNKVNIHKFILIKYWFNESLNKQKKK